MRAMQAEVKYTGHPRAAAKRELLQMSTAIHLALESAKDKDVVSDPKSFLKGHPNIQKGQPSSRKVQLHLGALLPHAQPEG